MVKTGKKLPAPGSTGSARMVLLVGVTLVVVALIAVLKFSRNPAPKAPIEGETSAANEEVAPVRLLGNAAAPQRMAGTARSHGSGKAPTQSTQASAPLPEASPATRQLVESLVKLDTSNGMLSPEQAANWRTNLAQLVQQGTAGIPAIREFLEKNTDFEFGAGGKQALGYSSARLALIDAAAQIGGPDGIGVMNTVLQSTADPKEIATIARNLEQADPSGNHQAVLEAARQTLAMAAEGKLPDRDVAPLFEVLKNYGDASVASELAGVSKDWNYYSMFTLGQLPDNAGIPSLIQIASGESALGSGARVPALEMLAQAASQSDAARNALIDQAKNNKLTAYNWATLEPILAGDQMRFSDSAYDSENGSQSTDTRRTHISSGNQNFYTAPPPDGLTAEQINQQNALIDELLKVTTDPAGIEALQRSKTLLQKRLPQGTPEPPPDHQ